MISRDTVNFKVNFTTYFVTKSEGLIWDEEEHDQSTAAGTKKLTSTQVNLTR